MPLITPSSAVVLYKGINITAGENIIFKSVANQRAYFAKHAVTSVNDCTYVRKTGRLRLEFPTATVAQCNYISFTNKAFENKTFYARIIDYEYINNVTTEIRYGIDYFQSFMFDVEYENSLIQREHLSETDFQKAEANPWDQSIYEFQTAEDLPSGRQIEKLYVGTTDNKGDFIVYPDPVDVGQNPNGILLQVATFDESLWKDFRDLVQTCGDMVTNKGQYLKREGTMNPYEFSNFTMPRAYNSIFIDWADGTGVTSQELNYVYLNKIIEWLVQNGLDTEIIGVYSIPREAWKTWLQDPNENFSTLTVNVDSNYVNSVINKKLCTSPYYYLRIENMDGSSKEYQYEKFYTMITGKNVVNFEYLSLLEGVPKTAMAPYNYMYKGGVQINDSVNINERIEKDAFPQVGYSSDAFLSFVSNQYNNTITSSSEADIAGYALANKLGGRNAAMIPALLNGTNQLLNGGSGNKMSSNFGESYGEVATYLPGDRTIVDKTVTPTANVMGIAGTVTGKATHVMNTAVSTLQNAMNAGQRYDEMDEANNRRDMTRGDIEAGVYGRMKDAFVADQYHPGTNHGIMNYYAGLGDIGSFVLTKVQLRPEILRQYDKYFSFYGYTSNRYGVPRVCNYIKGSGDQPHFDTTTDKHFTYLKCGSMHVVSPMMVVSEYIEALFTGGCRFFKGEDL